MSDRPTAAYKVLTDDQMRALEADEFIGSPVDQADGYIHLSTEQQLNETVKKHFVDQTNLWIAAVDLAALGDRVKWEKSRGGSLFPHIYGDLSLEVVFAYSPLEWDDKGNVRLPVAS